jgi:hypothetical protein
MVIAVPLMVVTLGGAVTVPQSTHVRPVIEQRTFSIWVTGHQHVTWDLVLKIPAGTCTSVTQGKGSENLGFVSIPENYRFQAVGNVAANFKASNASAFHIISTQERSASLTTTGCAPPVSAPTTNCNKLVHGKSTSLSLEYLTAKGSGWKAPGVFLNYFFIDDIYSNPPYPRFICPFMFATNGDPLELIASEALKPGVRYYASFAKATIAELLALPRGHKIELKASEPINPLIYCHKPTPPRTTCSFAGTITWTMTIKRE